MTYDDKCKVKKLEENKDNYIKGKHNRWLQAIGTNIDKSWFSKIQDRMLDLDVIALQANWLINAIESLDGIKMGLECRKHHFSDINAKRSKKGAPKLSWDKFIIDCDRYKKFVIQFPDLYSVIKNDIMMEFDCTITREEIHNQFSLFVSDYKFQGTKIPVCCWLSKHFSTLYEYICDYKFYNQGSDSQDRFKLHNKLYHLIGDFFKEVIKKVQDKRDSSFIYRYDGVWIRECDLQAWGEAFDIVSAKKSLPLKLRITSNNYVAALPPPSSSLVSSLNSNNNLFQNSVYSVNGINGFKHIRRLEDKTTRRFAFVPYRSKRVKCFEDFIINIYPLHYRVIEKVSTNHESEYKVSTNREKNNISKHRNGWKCRVHGKWIYSKVKNNETKEQFQEYIKSLLSKKALESIPTQEENEESSTTGLHAEIVKSELTTRTDPLDELLPASNDKMDGSTDSGLKNVDEIGRYL